MLQYTIDDLIELPLQGSVEVTITFPDGKRWLFFVTPVFAELWQASHQSL